MFVIIMISICGVNKDHSSITSRSNSSSSGTGALSGRRINLVAEKEVKSTVYSLAAVHGRIAAGIGSKVYILELVALLLC
jgi:hypothetical protein